MSRQNSWWYKTEEFFRDYPHGGPTSAAGGMTAIVKVYYLLQFSYWLQQALVMIAQLEAPRDDYVELILHVSPLPRRCRTVLIRRAAHHHALARWSIVLDQSDTGRYRHLRVHVSHLSASSVDDLY